MLLLKCRLIDGAPGNRPSSPIKVHDHKIGQNSPVNHGPDLCQKLVRFYTNRGPDVVVKITAPSINKFLKHNCKQAKGFQLEAKTKSMAMQSLRSSGQFLVRNCFRATRSSLHTSSQRFKSSKKDEEELEFFHDPDRFRRMLSKQEVNFTRDGFKQQRQERHGLGDFHTPHPGSFPKTKTPLEIQDEESLEYHYSIPNFETENFTFDSEAGILQEAEDERNFYENVVVPKTSNLSFRQLAEQIDVENQSNSRGFEVSKDPQEWSYVERLLPPKQVTPSHFEFKEYPSGISFLRF